MKERKSEKMKGGKKMRYGHSDQHNNNRPVFYGYLSQINRCHHIWTIFSFPPFFPFFLYPNFIFCVIHFVPKPLPNKYWKGRCKCVQIAHKNRLPTLLLRSFVLVLFFFFFNLHTSKLFSGENPLIPLCYHTSCTVPQCLLSTSMYQWTRYIALIHFSWLSPGYISYFIMKVFPLNGCT